MSKTCVAAFALASGLVLASGSLLAHHATAVFDLGKKLTVRVHYASKSAREKIEGAGGTLELLVEPKKPKPAKQKPAPPAEPVAEAKGSDPEAPEEE